MLLSLYFISRADCKLLSSSSAVLLFVWLPHHALRNIILICSSLASLENVASLSSSLANYLYATINTYCIGNEHSKSISTAWLQRVNVVYFLCSFVVGDDVKAAATSINATYECASRWTVAICWGHSARQWPSNDQSDPLDECFHIFFRFAIKRIWMYRFDSRNVALNNSFHNYIFVK